MDYKAKRYDAHSRFFDQTVATNTLSLDFPFYPYNHGLERSTGGRTSGES